MNKEEINKKFNELSWEIEKFPASHLQTSICLMVAELRSYFSNKLSLSVYCDDVSDKANEILKARIIELEKRDEVWRNKYALIQDDLAKAWGVVETQHNKLKSMKKKTSNTKWMIEQPSTIKGSAMWWCGNEDNPQDFTQDPNFAATFPTKESAQYVYRLLLDDHHITRKRNMRFGEVAITDHVWVDLPIKQKEVNKMNNSFYMIERNSIPFDTEWFCAGEDRWTKNADKAIHFPCKESAREVWRAIMQKSDICFPYEDLSADGGYEYSYDVTSHGWIRCETLKIVKK